MNPQDFENSYKYFLDEGYDEETACELSWAEASADPEEELNFS